MATKTRNPYSGQGHWQASTRQLGYIRSLAGQLGLNVEDVLGENRRMTKDNASRVISELKGRVAANRGGLARPGIHRRGE